MAKKAAPRSKSAAKAAPAVSAAAAKKPAARPRTPRRKPDTSVVAESGEATIVVLAPSEDEIRIRAYHRYLERGGNHGAEFDDWLEAERDLRASR